MVHSDNWDVPSESKTFSCTNTGVETSPHTRTAGDGYEVRLCRKAILSGAWKIFNCSLYQGRQVPLVRFKGHDRMDPCILAIVGSYFGVEMKLCSRAVALEDCNGRVVAGCFDCES